MLNDCFSALLLFMLRVLTDNHYFTFSLDHLAFFTDRLYGSSNFHFVSSFCVSPDGLSGFTSPGYPASCQVIRR